MLHLRSQGFNWWQPVLILCKRLLAEPAVNTSVGKSFELMRNPILGKMETVYSSWKILIHNLTHWWPIRVLDDDPQTRNQNTAPSPCYPNLHFTIVKSLFIIPLCPVYVLLIMMIMNIIVEGRMAISASVHQCPSSRFSVAHWHRSGFCHCYHMTLLHSTPNECK